MKNVVIYLRSTTTEQVGKKNSLANQEKKLRKYCSLNGLNIVKVFKDEGASGICFGRTAYCQLKRFIKNGREKVDGILFTEWSRFSRSLTRTYNELDQLRLIGIEANSIEQWIDFSAPKDHFLLPLYLVSPNIEAIADSNFKL